MPFDNRGPFSAAASQTQAASSDLGLRSYMLGIYNYMGAALALTGIFAYLTANFAPLTNLMYKTNELGQLAGLAPLGWVITFAPIGLVLWLGFKIQDMAFSTAQAVFWTYAALVGMSLSSLFLMYTGASITRVFFITAASFGALSLYGYTTKKDLTGMGSFLMMGLFGLIIASLANMFFKSGPLDLIISVIGVGIFAGLTAYDTQRLKSMYYQVAGNSEMAMKTALMGALSLYMDFINLFIYLMRFMGERR